MKRFINAVLLIDNWLVGLGAFFFVATLGLITANVIGRKLGFPILGVYDYLACFGMVMIGSVFAYVQVKKRQIAITVLLSRLPPRAVAIADAVTLFLGLGFVVLLLWGVYQYLTTSVVIKEVTKNTGDFGLTVFPFRFPLVLCLVILAIILCRDMVNAVRRGMEK